MEYSLLYPKTGQFFERLEDTIKTRKGERICLVDILKPFKDKGYSLESHMFLYFSKSKQIYVYCGSSATVSKSFILLKDISNNTIKLRCRNAKQSTPPEDKAVVLDKKTQEVKKCKRTKEKRIGEVIAKVTEWRQLYTGIPGPDGNIVKYSLEEAATRVGISKKTLDDYLLQLRAGKKYGFDFNMYKDEKVGVLRSFVKEKKGKL